MPIAAISFVRSCKHFPIEMKISRFVAKKKLRAVTARRSLRASAEAYDDMDEPNMKLSRALLIVLLLHIVAVSGIVAFNAIKTRQDSVVTTGTVNSGRENSGQPGPDARAPEARSETSEIVKPVMHGPVKSGEHAPKVADSGKVYVVVKGDNPVAIAKRLRVSYDDLIELNHISDPRKLQIGQKLLIPKASRGKKTDE
jgi:LysM repeat protein